MDEQPQNPQAGERWFNEETGLLMEWDVERLEWQVIESETLSQDEPFPCPACGAALDSNGFCQNSKCETQK